MNENNDLIEIPVPSEQQRMAAQGDTDIEIDEVPREGGHFSVDHRRC